MAAGQQAKGATAYVTLEPCNHFGRTPPCALALVDAGVSRVGHLADSASLLAAVLLVDCLKAASVQIC